MSGLTLPPVAPQPLPRGAGLAFPCHYSSVACPAWGSSEHSSLRLPAVSVWMTLSPSSFTCLMDFPASWSLLGGLPAEGHGTGCCAAHQQRLRLAAPPHTPLLSSERDGAAVPSQGFGRHRGLALLMMAASTWPHGAARITGSSHAQILSPPISVICKWDRCRPCHVQGWQWD